MTGHPVQAPGRAGGGRVDRRPPLAGGARAPSRTWRVAKDRLSKYLITLGGVSVIAALGLIFFFLFLEVVPALRPASAELVAEYPAPGGGGETLHLAMERYLDAAVRFTADGGVVFFRPADGGILGEARLPLPEGVGVTSFAVGEPRTRIVAYGLSDGTALVARHEYDVSFPGDVRTVTPRLELPLGAEPVPVDDEGQPLDRIAVQRAASGGIALAAATADGRLLVERYSARTSFLTGETELIREAAAMPGPGAPVTELRLSMDLRDLLVATRVGELAYYDLSTLAAAEAVDRRRVVPDGVEIGAIEYLLGTASFIVGGSDGGVVQWALVRDDANVRRLVRIREFDRHTSPVTVIRPEHARKGFATGDAGGVVALHFATSGRSLWRDLAGTGGRAITEASLAPRANALLVQDAAGAVRYYDVHNPHPEVSFAALWQRRWYEGRADAEYVWQSSSATDEFEPKLSLVPMTLGTVKAAFYAMLFAVPLAILGALYTGYFMAPRMRALVKPTIEIMEALPTVILGFLAGLWLSPFVESHLPAVFTLLVGLPAGIVLAALGWRLLPAAVTRRVAEGWEAALLMAVVVAVGWASVHLSPYLELWFFHGSMRQWLTEQGFTYDQRNALVVGIAMGFAVIPTIFSIAEDAVFNVPRHLSHGSLALGATPWQTLARVVLLTASPGLFAAVMIGLGRAVGETMIVLMATGNSPVVNFNIFEGMRTLSANVAVEMPETEVGGTHYRVLFLSALVLLVLTFFANTLAELVRQRLRKKYASI